jgi:hypothetical protein
MRDGLDRALDRNAGYPPGCALRHLDSVLREAEPSPFVDRSHGPEARVTVEEFETHVVTPAAGPCEQPLDDS